MDQSENEIKDAIRTMIGRQVSNIHTAIPGTVKAYDAGSNRATVQPFGNFKTDDGRSFPYPVIYNVPVVFPTGAGGSAGVTFPIIAGDGCLLVFGEDNLDDFLLGGDSDDRRKHALNDAICIPGLYSGTTAGAAHSGDTCLFNGGSMLRLNAGGLSGNVGGTTFSIGGGDLIVSGISLVHHTHPGDSGGTTGQPQ